MSMRRILPKAAQALPALMLPALMVAACSPLVQIGGNAPAPAELQTLRLPVQLNAASVQYLAGASWAEQPNRQFQRLLADRLAADGIAVLDSRTGSISPARQLTGTLREFGLDVRAAPVVRVRLDAQLAGPRGGGTVALRSFVAEEPVASQQPAAVAAALGRAANRLAAEVSAWVKG